MNKKLFLITFCLIFSLVITLIVPLSINAQTPTQGNKRTPERIIQEYLKKNNLDVKPGSSKYQILMKDVLLGEHPDLVALVGNNEIIDYALKQLNLKPDTDTIKLMVPKSSSRILEKNKLMNYRAAS